MMKWMKLAIRNILRNKRRSLVTLLAIGVGFSAVSLFSGYVSNIYSGLRESAIRGEGLGHLTIYKAGWLEKGKLDPERYMFSKAEVEQMTKLATAESGVILATPQIQVTGIVSNGITPTIFIGWGSFPRTTRPLKGTGTLSDLSKVRGCRRISHTGWRLHRIWPGIYPFPRAWMGSS